MWNSYKRVVLTALSIGVGVCLLAEMTAAATFHVSPLGSNTPPYDTYAKAARGVDIAVLAASGHGDTVLVHTGIYNSDTTIHIPAGLTWVGVGRDSVTLNWGRTSSDPGTLVQLQGDNDVSGLEFNYPMGSGFNGAIAGIFSYTTKSIGVHRCRLRQLMIVTGGSGKFESDSNEFLFGQTSGLNLGNGSSWVHDNTFSGSWSGEGVMCFWAGSVLIENNVFENDATHGRPTGISIDHASSVIVRNNLMLNCGEPVSWFYASGLLENNTIINASGRPFALPPYNNVSFNLRWYETVTIRNNAFVDLAVPLEFGPESFACCDTTGQITLVHNTFWPPRDSFFTICCTGPYRWRVKIRDSANAYVFPMFTGDSTYRLQRNSPLIDAGDPALKDTDSTRSDIGRWGGPHGSNYAYVDLPPLPPDSPWVAYADHVVTLTWSPRPETDLAGYRLYRGNAPRFWTPGMTPLKEFGTGVTHAIDTVPTEQSGAYYVMTAYDSAGLESGPSPELAVLSPDTGEFAIPRTPAILRTYPNPSNSSIVIVVAIPFGGASPAPAEVEVFNSLGEKVGTAFRGMLVPGLHPLEWQAVDSSGRSLASGVYFARLRVSSSVVGTPAKVVVVR